VTLGKKKYIENNNIVAENIPDQPELNQKTVRVDYREDMKQARQKIAEKKEEYEKLLQEQREQEKLEKEKEEAKTTKTKKPATNKSSKQVIQAPGAVDESIKLFNKDEEDFKKVIILPFC
jgi:hypothetical protein